MFEFDRERLLDPPGGGGDLFPYRYEHEDYDYDEDRSDKLNFTPNLMSPASLVMYDYMTSHRGSPNTSGNTARPMMYLLWANDGYDNSVNFGEHLPFFRDEGCAEITRNGWIEDNEL